MSTILFSFLLSHYLILCRKQICDIQLVIFRQKHVHTLSIYLLYHIVIPYTCFIDSVVHFLWILIYYNVNIKIGVITCCVRNRNDNMYVIIIKIFYHL